MPPAARNRTLMLQEDELPALRRKLQRLDAAVPEASIRDSIICQDCMEAVPHMPDACVDLLFVDPPYNLRKQFSNTSFSPRSAEDYMAWCDSWLGQMRRLLKPDASVYICGDWRSSAALQQVCERHFTIQNRITFEREKGRGAKRNWKNASEDIWFCTVSNDYYFNADAVKLRRQVIAPYRSNGKPKDWNEDETGRFRLTHPSNVWTDISIPFWSMPENTPHPTQKPEKLLAKIILASSRPGDLVFDPFAGSGTTGVTAKKLGRSFAMIEQEEEYCLYAAKRIQEIPQRPHIQGYHDEVFWERNTLALQKQGTRRGESS